MEPRWSFRSSPEGEVQRLAQELSVSPLVARLLIQRDLSDPTQAQDFLYPRLDRLHDPYLMKDMDRVVARIFEAKKASQKVLIYGDYDVDGIMATVVLRRALEMIGIASNFHVPRRLEEGYGLKAEVLQAAQSKGYGLVISVDSGIRAFEPCRRAREMGLDLIVTDHHLPADSLPEAHSILNPKRQDCTYPEQNLAAVGVVFKLVEALFAKLGKSELVRHFLKLVAIGTVADSVPLIGENRVIVKFGLEGLSEPHNLGLRALLEGAGVGSEVSQSDVGFRLAPRINASTRMGGGREVVELFALADAARARAIVQEMNDKNLERRAEEQRILEEIHDRYRTQPEIFERHFLVLVGDGWHRGVIGIVASRLAERFYRPVLVLSEADDGYQGSGRSIPGFHLLAALEDCRDFLLQFGGHAQAVGCSVAKQPELLEDLADRLDRYARSKLTDEQLTPVLEIDSLLGPQEISLSVWHDIQKLAPFGVGNPGPVFVSRQVTVTGGPWVLKDQHLKMRVALNGAHDVEAIWWRQAQSGEAISSGTRLDVAYTLTRNQFRGEEKVFLTLRDLRLPQTN